MSLRTFSLCLGSILLCACGQTWNDPYPVSERGANTLYSVFTERPKHLDPVQSYSADEIQFTAQVYQPLLQYHYLKRPYQVVPNAAETVPRARYFGADGRELPADTDPARIARSVYELRIRPGILYQPHPALALDAAGQPLYQHLDREQLRNIETLSDFKASGTRPLTAADYAYEIKRLADPRLTSPIFGLMSDYIIGLKELGSRLQAELKARPPTERKAWLDLRPHHLDGVQVLDDRTLRISIKGKYPQFLYWLTMPFFAPIPWEADRFYAQPGMAEKNLTLDWYPVGTGPYMLTENNPNARMVLERNPHFQQQGQTYPCEGEAGDAAKGLLQDCGQPLPFIDKVIFTREKEQIPYWNKFLQGYYDASGISSDSFDQAVRVMGEGDIALTESMQKQGIRLETAIATSTMYMGFNMLDPLLGGKPGDAADRERARKLRQALSIALDQEEFISIFLNGRGIAAQGPVPPGIFGHLDDATGINPQVYEWQDGKPKRKPLSEAQRLLTEAGYPNGRHVESGEPLLIALDTTGNGVGNKARTDWLVKQFNKINVQLVVRSTDYNRFQDKIRKGAVQLFYFGWNADYPDPENFLFLLHGKQSKVSEGGENAANYANPEYDALFEKVKAMDNSPARQALINRMVDIVRRDAPWIWGFHPKEYVLVHAWLKNRKASTVGNDTLKYQKLDPELRERKRREWNQPVLWPLGLAALLLTSLGLPAWRTWRQKEEATAKH